jgi:hypothetical protein
MMLEMMCELVSPIIAGFPMTQENLEIYQTGKYRYSLKLENPSKQGP